MVRKMNVCITVSEKSIDAQLDPRFGRCRFLMFVDPVSLEMEAVDNPGFEAVHGAGVQAAQIVIDKGAEAIITGNIGPNAYQVLNLAGIKVITGASGSVKEVLQRYQKGELKEASASTVPAHFGIGMGRGMGLKGGGRGLGWRSRKDFAAQIAETWSPSRLSSQQDNRFQNPEEELSALEDCRKQLEQDLEGINARIKDLRSKGK